MKPDWINAPDWANYLVMTFEGRWIWTQKKPRLFIEDGQTHWAADCGKWEVYTQKNWEQTMEERPRK